MKTVALFFIRFYQLYLSMLFKMVVGQKRLCFQDPTCSEYTKQAIIHHGLLRGIIFGLKRILSCRPRISYV